MIDLITEPTQVYPVIKPEPESTAHDDKLYVITHAGLSTGYQTAQVAHAIAEFHAKFPEEAECWSRTSNSIIVLETPNAQDLYKLWWNAIEDAYPHAIWREADYGDEITSIAFPPSDSNKNRFANLPVAGRMTTDEDLERNKKNRKKEINYRRFSEKLRVNEQTAGQSILAHGASVRDHYFALVEHLLGNVNLSQYSNWKLPSWINDNKEFLIQSFPNQDWHAYVLDRYLTLHDCGKPDVEVKDETGRTHFPEHEKASRKAYIKFSDKNHTNEFGEQTEWYEDSIIAEMIGNDMLIHTLKADGISEFCNILYSLTHLLVGVATVHSNASMFGGIDSTSFKIKWKTLESRGKQIIATLKEQNYLSQEKVDSFLLKQLQPVK